MAKFCPNCGNPLSSETLKFCPECGASVASVSIPNASTPQPPKVEESKEEKIYYQDSNVKIGSNMWVFLQCQGGNGKLSISENKHIPVQAISSVDYKSFRSISIAMLMASIFSVFIIVNFEEYILLIISLSVAILALVILPLGTIVIHTNNIRSGISFPMLKKKDAEKYLNPMLQCLQERKL